MNLRTLSCAIVLTLITDLVGVSVRSDLTTAETSILQAAQTTGTTSRQTSLHDPSSIERMLRPAGRIVGEADSVYSITERMRYWNIPGVSVAIVDDFKIVYAKGFGVTEFGGNTPVDTSTIFQAGSVSKAVFATAVMKLVAAGDLNLEADVNAKLKSWRLPDSEFTAVHKVTLRHLLTHTAGLTVPGFPGFPPGAKLPTIPQVLDGLPPANTAPVRSDASPGTRWRYSGGGIIVAQLLATDVTGEPFPALMQRLVLGPIGMTRSTFESSWPLARIGETAAGHYRPNRTMMGRFRIYPEMAAASLWTTATDLARWAIALSHAYNGREGGAVPPSLARQMVMNYVDIPEPDGRLLGRQQGLGVRVSGDGDSLSFGHTGHNVGFVASVQMWPRIGRGLVIMTNGNSDHLINEITRAVGETYRMPGPERIVRTTVSPSAETLVPLTGHFVLRQELDTGIVEVTAQDTVLRLTNTINGRSFRLWPLGNDVFFDVNTGNTVTFERQGDAPNARALALRLGTGRNAPVATRQNP